MCDDRCMGSKDARRKEKKKPKKSKDVKLDPAQMAAALRNIAKRP